MRKQIQVICKYQSKLLGQTPSYARIEEVYSIPGFEEHVRWKYISDLWQETKDLYAQLGNIDSKFIRFKEQLNRILDESTNTKMIVYSFFKPTLKYLKRRLNEVGIAVELIDGDVPVKNRKGIMDRFRDSIDKRILLSSEVGSEGLDFQFCNCVINYDLPWNPMRVEQRIGRVDRYGQMSNKVSIVSFFLSDTIEERILKRLYERIKIFEESIGALEPILGNIEKELAYEVISNKLTPEQELTRTEKYLNMIEFKKLEQADFEKNRYELIGQDQFFGKEVDDNIATGRYVSCSEIRALISQYLEKKCPKSTLREVDIKSDNWVLEPDLDLYLEMNKYLSRSRGKRQKNDDEFLALLQNRTMPNTKLFTTVSKGIPLTFKSDLAIERPLLDFVHIMHPLTLLAFDEFAHEPFNDVATRMVKFKASAGNKKTGVYYFFIYWLSIQAISRQDELIPLCLSTSGDVDWPFSEQFLKFLHDNLSDFSITLDDAVFNYQLFVTLQNKAIEFMALTRDERENVARQRNDALIAVRKDALGETFDAKIRRSRDRLAATMDPRLIRMFEGEIRNLNGKRANALSEVESKRNVSVFYEPVCCGIVELV